jgi:quercetin dioxygenase-like cupin family protein
MNIQELLPHENAVSIATLFETDKATVKAIQILKGEELKEHVTNVPALLICLSGKGFFENEDGIKETLLPGAYIRIAPAVKHWVNAVKDSQFILFK